MPARNLLPILLCSFLAMSATAASLTVFDAPPVYRLDCSGDTLIAMDVNGDGKADLLVLRSDGSVATAISRGDGSFEPCRAAGIQHQSGLQLLDRAHVAAWSDGALSVFHLTGDGSFTLDQQFSLPFSGPATVAVGDLNGDGVPDIAIGSSSSASMAFALSSAGVYSLATKTLAGSPAQPMSIGDFDGDGRADVIVFQSSPRSSVVLKGDGTGGFVESPGWFFPLSATSIAFGDFNGDGIMDAFERGTLWVAVKKSDGITYAPHALLPFGVYRAVWSMDADGLPNLIVQTAVGISIIHVRRDLSFDRHDYRSINGIVVGDFDGDGRPDVWSFDAYFRLGSLLRGAGDGSLVAPQQYGFGQAAEKLVIGDFDGDGRADVIGVGSPQSNFYRNRGDGTLARPVPLARMTEPSQNYSLASADFDGDGKLDVAMGANLYFGNGDGTFTAGPTLRDRAGALITRWTTAKFLPGNRTQFFDGNNASLILTVTPSRTVFVGEAPRAGFAADLNGDGLADLVSMAANVVVVYLNDGFGGFGQPVLTKVQYGPTGAGDVDGHGRDDLFAGPFVHRSNGDGTLRELEPAPCACVGTSDIDGDGKNDILNGERLSVRAVLLSASQSAVALPDTLIGFADFDGDGRADLVGGDAGAFTIYFQRSVNPGALHSTLTVTPPTTPLMFGTAVTIKAAVTGDDGANLPGVVEYKENGRRLAIGASTSISGLGAVEVFLPAGSHHITAAYGGSATHAPSTAEFDLSIAKVPTGITFTVGVPWGMPIPVPVIFSSNVTEYDGVNIDIGMFIDAKQVGTVKLTRDNFTAAGYLAATPILPLTPGGHPIYFGGPGDRNHESFKLDLPAAIYIVPHISLERSTITATQTAPGVWSLHLNVLDANGRPVTLNDLAGQWGYFLSTAGRVHDVGLPVGNVYTGTLDWAPKPGEAAIISATIGRGVPIATPIVINGPPLRRRSAGH